MTLLRSARPSDLDALFALAKEATLGVTNLPKSRELLQERLSLSESSFAKEIQEPKDEIYIFVLEDENGEVVGTSSILASSHFNQPAPYFKKIHIRDIPTLQLYFDGSCPTELCALYLRTDKRHLRGGRLLSLGRLLFIADHLQRFRPMISADLRGIIYEDGNCPFWDAVVRPFCPFSFQEALDIYINRPKELFSLLPKEPIYIPMLPAKIQEVIGQVHEGSLPAMKMLEQEGFSTASDVHPLDGGPRLLAQMRQIRSIQKSSLIPVEEFDRDSHSLVATTEGPFMAAMDAEALKLKKGTLVRTIRERP